VMPLPTGTSVILGFDFANRACLNIDWDQCLISFTQPALRSSVLSEEHYCQGGGPHCALPGVHEVPGESSWLWRTCVCLDRPREPPGTP
jgi:hypothetical protein